MFWSRKKKMETAPAMGKDVAAELWGEKARNMVSNKDWSRNLWQSHPITQAHIQRLMTGDPNVNWLNFVKQRYCETPRETGLSLGCGEGCAERDAIQLGLCMQMEAYDLSPGAIQAAEEQAAAVGMADRIRYGIADLDEISLPAAAYDLIIAGQSVHHISNLEHLAEQLHKSLRPGGILILNEYVGPSRFQWTDKVDRLMNDLLNLLPPEKRIMQNGTEKPAILRPTPEQVAKVDPTESVRSAEILPVFSQYFAADYSAPFGGTLLQFLLSEIVANFNEHDERDRARIDMLVYFEETLIREGVIDSDFVFAVMSAREGAGGP
jgi:SAM-dependent methyltransferase